MYIESFVVCIVGKMAQEVARDGGKSNVVSSQSSLVGF